MATYTAEELQSYTSIPGVPNWEDEKVLLYQTMAESILTSLDLDTSVEGYANAYNSAVILLFDWLAQNPTGLTAKTMGKVSYKFNDLPITVQMILKRAIEGEDQSLEAANLERMDIGRR